MRTYTLVRVGLWSLLKIGFLISWIVSFLPIALLTIVFTRTVAALTAWLSTLVYHVRLPLPGDFGFDLNLVDLLHLQGLIDSLNRWVVVGIIPLFMVILVLTSLVAVLGGLATVLGGLVFNLFSRLSGGIQVTLSEKDLQPGKDLVAAPDRDSVSTDP